MGLAGWGWLTILPALGRSPSGGASEVAALGTLFGGRPSVSGSEAPPPCGGGEGATGWRPTPPIRAVASIDPLGASAIPFPDFDRGTNPTGRLSVRAAVDRGHAVINHRVAQIMGVLFLVGVAVALLADRLYDGFVIALSAPFVAWVWWAYATPRWRDWAHARGVDAEELQRVAEAEKLVWPVGHFFQYTEFRFWRK